MYPPQEESPIDEPLELRSEGQNSRERPDGTTVTFITKMVARQAPKADQIDVKTRAGSQGKAVATKKGQGSRLVHW